MKNICNELDPRLPKVYKAIFFGSLAIVILRQFIFPYMSGFVPLVVCAVYGMLAIYELVLLAKNIKFINLIEDNILRVVYYQLMRYIKPLIILSIIMWFTNFDNFLPFWWGGSEVDSFMLYGAILIYVYMFLLEALVIQTEIHKVIIKLVIYLGITLLCTIPYLFSMANLLLVYILTSANLIYLSKQKQQQFNYLNLYLIVNLTIVLVSTALISICADNLKNQVFAIASMGPVFKIGSIALFIIFFGLQLIVGLIIAKALEAKLKYCVRPGYQTLALIAWQLPIYQLVQSMFGGTDAIGIGVITVELAIIVGCLICSVIFTYKSVCGTWFSNQKIIRGVDDAYVKWVE